MKRKFIHLLGLLVAAYMILLASCSTSHMATPVNTPTTTSQPTAYPTGTMTLTPLPSPSATLTPFPSFEKEIVDFVLNSFYQEYLLGIQQFPDPFLSLNHLIVWQTLKKPTADSPNDYSNPKAPIQAWMFTNGEMTEVIDKHTAIQRYETVSRQTGATPPASPWTYAGFGIISISGDGKEAKLYVSWLCGGLCGQDYIDTLQRNQQGGWMVIDHEIVGYH